MLWELQKRPNDVAEAERRAHRRTWALLERVFMGTDGSSGPYRRYMVYLEGNVNCWRAAEANPGVIEEGDLGKFDIINERHRRLLKSVGVLGVESSI
jgi:hypothetical protein